MVRTLVAEDFYKEKQTEWLVIMPDAPGAMAKRPRLGM